jgi:hypothetical protein
VIRKLSGGPALFNGSFICAASLSLVLQIVSFGPVNATATEHPDELREELGLLCKCAKETKRLHARSWTREPSQVGELQLDQLVVVNFGIRVKALKEPFDVVTRTPSA